MALIHSLEFGICVSGHIFMAFRVLLGREEVAYGYKIIGTTGDRTTFCPRRDREKFR